MSDSLSLDLIGTSESQVQNGVPGLPNETSRQSADSSEEFIRKLWKPSWRTVIPVLQRLFSNATALASRFIQISCRPEQLAPVILDFLSLTQSIIWTERQPGPDFLYPFSSLKTQKSGRLAKQFLEHCRDQHLHNLHDALSPRNDIDPPRVAVIDLDEVQPEIIEREYTVSADFYGFMVMVLFFEILIMFLLVIISPTNFSLYFEWISGWAAFMFGDWIGAWIAFIYGLFSDAVIHWMNGIGVIFFLCVYAVIRGEGTLTLVRRSDISAPGCAVLLDRDFTVILTGTQNVVEAIAESSFNMSQTLARRYQLVGWQVVQTLFDEALKALCQGLPFLILAGLWLQLGPTSPLMAFVPLVPAMVVSFMRVRSHPIHVLDRAFEGGGIIFLCNIAPTFLLIFTYELAIVKNPLLRSHFQPTIFLHTIPYLFLIIHFIASQNCHIRTAKLLDILGRPEVRRWEFNTLAAAATFQCLVLCRGIPRPVKSIDVLTLLDTFVPDQKDVWKIWKARVADRIAHEVDISFAPTLPSFGDLRQKHLKELLDEAQTGYGVYTNFYDWHVPLHSTITL